MPKEIILLFTGFCNNMAFHAKTVNMTHNLEVPGSSPGWSTKEVSEDCSEAFFILPITSPQVAISVWRRCKITYFAL